MEPPLEAIRDVFGDGVQFVPLPRTLQTSHADSFCVVWGVWFMTGGIVTDASLANLLHWLKRLLSNPVLGMHFQRYLQEEACEVTATRAIAILHAIDEPTYVRAYDNTEGLDE